MWCIIGSVLIGLLYFVGGLAAIIGAAVWCDSISRKRRERKAALKLMGLTKTQRPSWVGALLRSLWNRFILVMRVVIYGFAILFTLVLFIGTFYEMGNGTCELIHAHTVAKQASR